MKVQHAATTCVVFLFAACWACSARRLSLYTGDAQFSRPPQGHVRRKIITSRLFYNLATAEKLYFSRRYKKDYPGRSSRSQLQRYWRQRHHSFGDVSSLRGPSSENLRRYWNAKHRPFTPSKTGKVIKPRERKLKHINTVMQRKNQLIHVPPKKIFACPLRDDGSETQTCPSDATICLRDDDICNNHRDCPGGEDEKPAVCLLRNWIIRWMLRLQVMIYH